MQINDVKTLNLSLSKHLSAWLSVEIRHAAVAEHTRHNEEKWFRFHIDSKEAQQHGFACGKTVHTFTKACN